jgi:Pyridoxal-phosphate dependent enzyme
MFLIAIRAMLGAPHDGEAPEHRRNNQTIGRTPVVRINRLVPPGVNLFVKIEAFNPLGSVKDRLALGVIEAAEKSGELKPGQTVIEATSGNTGIGLAMVCAAKGYPLVVTMAEPFSVERRKLMRFLGARVIVTPAAERGMGMVAKANELAKAHGWFMTRQFENEANPDFHSRTTAREILDDFAGERLDYWVTGYGTGGTLKASRGCSPRSARKRLRSGWEHEKSARCGISSRAIERPESTFCGRSEPPAWTPQLGGLRAFVAGPLRAHLTRSGLRFNGRSTSTPAVRIAKKLSFADGLANGRLRP